MCQKAWFIPILFTVVCMMVSTAAYSHGFVVDADGQKTLFYSKKDGDSWATVIKTPQGLKTRDEVFHMDMPDMREKTLQNSGLFLPYQAYPVGSWPEAVAIGDVNNDGRNDVVMTTSYYFDPENDYHIFVFLQNQYGELEAPVKYPAGNGESIDIGDVNNDGRADVVVTAQDAVGVFLQNDSGGLDPMVTYTSNHSSSSNTYKVRIGDFSDDGLLDVVSIDWGTQSHDVDVFLQNTEGTLNPPVSYVVEHGGWDDLEVGDVNSDGLQDIIVMSGQYYAYDNIGILLQRPDGTFEQPVYYDLGGDELTSGVGVGDVNGDTLEDIVVSYGGNRPNSFIATFLQNSTGTLDPPISYSSYDIPEPVEVADVDLDGRNDVIVAHGGWMAMGVYLQGANGTLLPYELYSLPYASHYNPQGLVVGDINGDGLNDVVIADYNHGLIVLYRQPTAITLLTPNGGETWEVGALHYITWNTIGNPGEYVQIEISRDGGSTWSIITASAANDGSYGWYVTGPGSTQCRIRITSTSNSSYTDTSNANFAIFVPDLTLMSPNGGEVISSGSNYTIEWDAPLEMISFTLKCSQNNGGRWKPLESGITDTSYNWRVPTPLKNKKNCLVKVIGYDGSDKKVGADKSDSTFTIEVVKVTWPNGGETLTSGDIPTITWITHETKKDVARVILKYTQNGGRAWNKIATLDGNPGSYNEWTVPDVSKTKNKCKVKAVLKALSGKTVGSDTSDSYFTIQPIL